VLCCVARCIEKLQIRMWARLYWLRHTYKKTLNTPSRHDYVTPRGRNPGPNQTTHHAQSTSPTRHITQTPFVQPRPALCRTIHSSSLSLSWYATPVVVPPMEQEIFPAWHSWREKLFDTATLRIFWPSC